MNSWRTHITGLIITLACFWVALGSLNLITVCIALVTYPVLYWVALLTQKTREE